MILFNEIFSRAVNLFDDPDIRQKYVNDPAGFGKIMRKFLINGMNKFTNPTSVVDLLALYSDEIQMIEEEDSPNNDTEIVLETLESMPEELRKGVTICSVHVGGNSVSFSYNYKTNILKFSKPVTKPWRVEWYYAGAFTADFEGTLGPQFPMYNIVEKLKNILAHCLLAAWGDQEMNRALEFRNILSDSDLKFYSPANSARAKTEWHNQINRDLDTLVQELNWRLVTPKSGSHFGK